MICEYCMNEITQCMCPKIEGVPIPISIISMAWEDPEVDQNAAILQLQRVVESLVLKGCR